MSKDQQSAFYKTKAWKKCREAYLRYKGGLCERCLASGLVTPAEIVHHRIHINPTNVKDPKVLLDWENLQCVCRDCHAALHPEMYQKTARRFTIDKNGHVESREREADARSGALPGARA